MKALVAVFLLVASIAAAEDAPQNAPMGQRARPQNTLKVKAGDKVIDFKLNDIEAKEVESSVVRKDKVVILSITPHNSRFSTSHIEMLNMVADKFLGKAIVLNVVTNSNLSREEIIDYYQKSHASFSILIDEKQEVVQQYGSFVSPSVIVIDKEGKITEIFNYSFHYNPNRANTDIFRATEQALGVIAEE